MYQEKKIIFIHDPGVIGVVVSSYSDNSINAIYYLDGISYRVSLLEDEYDRRFDAFEN